MLDAGPVASRCGIFCRSLEGRFVDSFFNDFGHHFGVPNLVIFGSIFGPPKKGGGGEQQEVKESSGRLRQRPGEG